MTNVATTITQWQPAPATIEMYLTAPAVLPVVQKVGRDLRAICEDAHVGLGAVSFGFMPVGTKVYRAASGTDWHVMALRDLLSYQIFGVLEVPRDHFYRLQSLEYRKVTFDEVYIAVETKPGDALRLGHTTAPAHRAFAAYTTKLAGYEFANTMDEATTRLLQLDPILFGVKFIGKMGRGTERLVGAIELARWSW